MEENCTVLPPIKFNCWKHHAMFIKKELKNFKNEVQIEQLQSRLLKIGESQMDLYYGKFTPDEIANQIIVYLLSIPVKNNEQYTDWLSGNGKEYRIITLNDKSIWTLRSGDDISRYVHIHPGRYSPYSVRVKALTLKTVICALAFSKVKSTPVVDIDIINEAREKLLNAPPLKSINKEKGLGKLMNLLGCPDI